MSPVGDMPTMLASNYTNNTYSAAEMLGSAATSMLASQRAQQELSLEEKYRRGQLLAHVADKAARQVTIREDHATMPSRRIVQVYIADPCEDVPLADAVLYTGKQQMTDLTDQELFFEIDIKDLLAEHNEKRSKIINKKVKDRTEYLEPVKVRDLKMVVVTVASF